MTPRRYYLLKMHAALAACDDGLAAAWRSKHDAEAGTPLPADVLSTALSDALYTAVEDVDGATVGELALVDVPMSEAQTAIDYVASLPVL